jgi:integrase
MELRERKGRSGKVLFFLDYRVEGQRVRENLKGITDRKTAELYLAKRRLEVARGQVGVATHENLSVSACLASYVAGREAVTKESHIRIVKARVKQIEMHFGADKPVRTLSESAVNAWRTELKRAGESPSTINRKAGILRAAIAKAVKDGKLARNPIEHLERLSDDSRPVWRWLRANEIQALLGVLRAGVEVEIKPRNRKAYTATIGNNEKLYRLVVFLLNTGARVGEALAARWSDIDFERGILTLHTTKAAARGAKAKPRHVPLNAAVRELLEGMKRTKEEETKRAKKEGTKQSEEAGAKRTRETIFDYPNNRNRDFERACELAGIGHCRIHDLRHTAASHLVMAGTPLNTVRELLGHSTMTMTLRYAHLAPEATAKAVETLNFGGSGQVAEVVSIGQKAG